MTNNTLINVRPAIDSGLVIYVADGPDGHLSLLARGSEAEAVRDGLEYFLRTREYSTASKRWVIR